METISQNTAPETSNIDSDILRIQLPHREKTELILLNQDGNVLGEDHGSYIMFPGGGIDSTDKTIYDAGERELLEETHMNAENLFYMGDVSWNWFPEWANNEKRKKRYEKYRGEKVHHFVGKCHPNPDYKSSEEDKWLNTDGIPLEECIRKIIELANKDHPNTYPYRIAQLYSLKTLACLEGIELPNDLGSIRNNMI